MDTSITIVSVSPTVMLYTFIIPAQNIVVNFKFKHDMGNTHKIIITRNN